MKSARRKVHGDPEDINDWNAVKSYIKKIALNAWHPTSPCAMLPLDEGGVVSEVYETKNLRVVGASISPLSTRGNCQTRAYAGAEKAAGLIKSDNGIQVGRCVGLAAV